MSLRAVSPIHRLPTAHRRSPKQDDIVCSYEAEVTLAAYATKYSDSRARSFEDWYACSRCDAHACLSIALLCSSKLLPPHSGDCGKIASQCWSVPFPTSSELYRCIWQQSVNDNVNVRALAREAVAVPLYCGFLTLTVCGAENVR
jgi:hypothetical protein